MVHFRLENAMLAEVDRFVEYCKEQAPGYPEMDRSHALRMLVLHGLEDRKKAMPGFKKAPKKAN